MRNNNISAVEVLFNDGKNIIYREVDRIESKGDFFYIYLTAGDIILINMNNVNYLQTAYKEEGELR
jgi:hypothetical protein